MQNTFSYIDVLKSIYALVHACKFVYSQLRPSRLPRYLHGNKEVWALGTGASDGVGEDFAPELCRQGFNVILHGRNEQKLEKVAASLARDYPSHKTRLFIANISVPASFDEILDIVKDLNLIVLINNVGGLGHLRSPFVFLQEHT